MGRGGKEEQGQKRGKGVAGCLMYILKETERGRVSQEKEEGQGYNIYVLQDGNGLKGGGNVDWSSNEYYQQGQLV